MGPQRAYPMFRAKMVERFPNAFVPHGTPKRPLKLNIHADLIAACPDLEPWRIRKFLRRYTLGTAYLVALREAADRLDLKGFPDGRVSASHAAHARAEIERRLVR